MCPCMILVTHKIVFKVQRYNKIKMKLFLPLAALIAVVNAALVEYTWNICPRRSRDPLSPDCFTGTLAIQP